MPKKILIISTSLRKGGNSETLAKAFAKGANKAGNTTEFISLADKKIAFCRGCLSCLTTNQCVIKDDAREIVASMQAADVLVFSTPIYYYEMSGQMKTLLDRANPLFSSDYAFRDIYLLTAAAEDDVSAADGATTGLNGFVECFPKATFSGTVFAGGVDSIGKINGHPALQTAYELGLSLT